MTIRGPQVGLPLLPKLNGQLWTLDQPGNNAKTLCVPTALECDLFAATSSHVLLDCKACCGDTAAR